MVVKYITLRVKSYNTLADVVVKICKLKYTFTV